MSRYQPYPSYKDSGVEWLRQVPEGWEIKKLKYNLVLQTQKVTIDGHNVIALENIESKSGKHVPTESFYQGEDVAFKSGDILFGKLRPYLAKVYKCDSNGVAFGDLLTYRPIKDFDSSFAFYSLLSDEFIKIVDSSAYGTKMPRASSEFINEMIFATPSYEEQTAIANFLDTQTAKIDTLIAKQQRMIELLGEKRSAMISHAVTKGIDEENSHWKNYRLDWINTIIRGNTGFKKDELLDNGEYVALQYGKTYKVDEVNEVFKFYVNSEFYKFNQVVNYGDTILISTSETIQDLGHSCFYNRNDLGLIGGEQILLKPNSKFIFEKYLYYSSKVFCGELRKYATGSKVFRFNIDDLKTIFISIPSVEEQQIIVNYLDDKTKKIDTLIAKSRRSIELMKERRTALISAAVTGKIDVRGIAL